AFLQSARQLRLTDAAAPPRSALARAYFRDINRTPPEPPTPTSPSFVPPSPPIAPPEADVAAALAAIVELVGATGESRPRPRALLAGESNTSASFAQFHAHMQFVSDADIAAYTARTEEFAYLVNTMLAGGSVQGRGFTPREASDAATAICNLGLQHWPAQWLAETTQ